MPGILFALAFLALMIWMFVRIADKAGFNGLWSVTMVLPLVNIVMLYVFAYARWPNLPEATEPAEPS